MSDSSNSLGKISKKLGLSLNIVSIIFIVIFLVIFFTLRHITILKWIVFVLVLVLNSGNLINNIKDGVIAIKENNKSVTNIIFGIISLIGIIAPVLLMKFL